MKSWITVEEFAEETGISAYTVRKLCRNGEIPARKAGKRWLILTDLLVREAVDVSDVSRQKQP